MTKKFVLKIKRNKNRKQKLKNSLCKCIQIDNSEE